MIVRINGHEIETIPVYQPGSVIVHLYTDETMDSVYEKYHTGIFEQLSEVDNETVLERFTIRDISAIRLTGTFPRELEVMLDVSVIGDAPLEAMREIVSDTEDAAGLALIYVRELQETVEALTQRVKALEDGHETNNKMEVEINEQ